MKTTDNPVCQSSRDPGQVMARMFEDGHVFEETANAYGDPPRTSERPQRIREEKKQVNNNQRHGRTINNKGITIIELVVVIALIVLLGTLALSRYNTFVIKSKIQEAVLMVKHLQELADAYYANHGVYPNQDGTYLFVASKSLSETPLAQYSFYDALFGRTEQRLKEMGVTKPNSDSRFWYYYPWWGLSGAATRIIYAYPKDPRDFMGFTEDECDRSLELVTVAIDNDGQIYVWGVPGLEHWY